MKILYASYRYDPTNPDLGSSVDYECYQAFQKKGHSVTLIGPLDKPEWFIERVEIKLWQFYKRVINKAGMKFPLTTALRASLRLRKAIKKTNPDVVFSLFPPFFVFFQSPVPCAWFFDTTFIGQEADWPIYGKLALQLSILEEKKAIKHITQIITNSEWSKKVLINEYNISSRNIEIIPLVAAIPKSYSEDLQNFRNCKQLNQPYKILMVGRVYLRKGVDIALEVVKQLDVRGIPIVLKICGISDAPANTPKNVEFVGPYKKSDQDQLKAYVELYQWAHLLIHPARFEAAGIVPSEAAAFGTPTITNDTGGLGTSVKDRVSGIVLPKGSPPEAYARAIQNLVENPERYYALCESTRQRYEQELNWDSVGKRLVDILEQVVSDHRNI